MTERTEIVLAGLAGQGVVYAGAVLADAAGLYQGKFVSQLGFYGMSVRTGPSRSEVVIAEEEIDFPAATQPDIVLALTRGDAEAYASKMRPGGLLIVDSEQGFDSAKLTGTLLVYSMPLLSIAKHELGEALLVNLVGLGALSALSGIVSLEALERAVFQRASASERERNLEALRRGHREGGLRRGIK